MGVEYKALLVGHLDPIHVARMIAKHYGGSQFSVQLHDDIDTGFYHVNFLEQPTAEQQAMRPWDRNKRLKNRSLAVFTDGSCADDYKDVTKDPMTYVSLKHWGDAVEIIDLLVAQTGGWVMDEAGDQEWRKVDKTLD